MTKRYLYGVFVTVGLLSAGVAGCSSGHRTVPATTAPPRTSTTAPRRTTTTLAVLTVEEAGGRYRAAADALNPRVTAAKVQLAADQGNFTRTKTDYQALADSYRPFDAAIKKIGFPQAARADANQLMAAGTALELELQAAADASTPGSLAVDEGNVATAARIQAAYAAAVRRDLGLPAASS